MSLSKTQREFVWALSKLINYAYEIGCELTLGDGYRDPRLHGDHGTKKGYGAAKSVHKIRLAQDYNLFVDGKYITDGGHAKYALLGKYWKTLHPLARWGGDFVTNDSNHFSFEYWGCK